MVWRLYARRAAATGMLTATLASVFITTGCRTTTDDVHRWGRTKQGPGKLIAVLTHDKYPIDLRVESAMTLVRMKPRNGKRVGITCADNPECVGLLEALSNLPAEDRKEIVSKVVPQLVAEIRKPPPQAQAGQPAPADTSYPYKDAAYALLTYEDKDLLGDDKLRAEIKAALAEWALADFANRLDNTTQMSGMEQVLRTLGAPGVKELPKLMVPGAKRISNMASLVAELGDAETKLAASSALVKIAKEIESDRWKKQKEAAVDAANKASGLTKVTKDQLAGQLEAYQEEELLRTFSSMKEVGGKPVVDYLLEYASREDKEGKLEKRRATALAALAGHLDKDRPEQIEVVMKLASAPDTSNTIRSVALQRIGEMPRKLVIDKLYDLFKADDWKLRWVAADLALRMSDQSQLDEFMTKLARNDKGMSISEPALYGVRMGELKGSQKGEELADKYLGTGYAPSVRLSALAYYSKYGTKDQLGKMTPYEQDSTKVPSCKADDCEWKCEVPVGDKGDKTETKDVSNIGDFVRYCVKPSMEKRTEADKKKEEEERKKQEAAKKQAEDNKE